MTCLPCEIDQVATYLFNRGENIQAYNLLGAFPEHNGVKFVVWAPRALSVAVSGDFNGWPEGESARDHLYKVGSSGLWGGFIPEARVGQCYKYVVRGATGTYVMKADPFARSTELRPATASIVSAASEYCWGDQEWLIRRPAARANNYPLNIYEVHVGSWRRKPNGELLNWREFGERLAAYVRDMGYTHVELLPIMEHPLDASWGYQVSGFFAPTARFGKPDDLRYCIDHLHQNGIGVILDWVPAHFPRDLFALYCFDGLPLYEHSDKRLREQDNWGTLIFDYDRSEVRSFLMSSAFYWIEEFHADGFRFDAVSVMLYNNYGEDSFVPNIEGGRENLGAIKFIRELNERIEKKHPQVILCAEEATVWQDLTKPVSEGGLGFHYKWDMGWMHGTLDYFSTDHFYRPKIHNKISFAMSYAFSERFIKPLSHDEVVHGKRSLLDRMPGDYWRRFAGLRLLYLYMISHPGGKLLFMGAEFGQFIEWRYYEELEWFMLDFDKHRELHDFVRRLNYLYKNYPMFYEVDNNWEGFSWINPDDADNAVYSYWRRDSSGNYLIFLLNMIPRPLKNYVVGVPEAGSYSVLLDTDAAQWGGSGWLSRNEVPQKEVNTSANLVYNTDEMAWNGYARSLTLDLPPLAGLILKIDKQKG